MVRHMPAAPPSDRTRLRRRPQRGTYDRAVIEAILDEALICHVGFVERDQPYVVPTVHARIGSQLYLHGARANRMLTALVGGAPACVTATLVDGVVLARSALHHSMNFRSVMVLAVAREVVGEEKRAALRAIVEHVTPGRWADVREPTEAELVGTLVVAVPTDEASAKVRVGPPVDDAADYALPAWAGELPLQLVAGDPVPDPRLSPGTGAPPYLSDYRRTVTA